MQPRTSLSKFGADLIFILFNALLTDEPTLTEHCARLRVERLTMPLPPPPRRAQDPKLAEEDFFCHPLAAPEAGCLLIAGETGEGTDDCW